MKSGNSVHDVKQVHFNPKDKPYDYCSSLLGQSACRRQGEHVSAAPPPAAVSSVSQPSQQCSVP